MKLLICLLLISISAWAKSGEIIVSSAVEISPRKTISAYDIVEAKNVSVEVLEQLKDIEVADSQSIQIKQSELAKKLRSIDTHFKFPQFVKLIRSQQAVSRMELERKIKNHLLSKCEDCEFKISINSVPKTTEANWDIDLNIDLNKKSVLIPLFVQDQPNQKGWVTVEIKKYQNVFVVNQDIKSGEILNESSFNKELRDVSNIRNIILNIESIKGMQAHHFLSTGEVLKSSDLKKEILLKRGQLVKAVFDQDQIQVSISAMAEESGSIGDVLKFKNSDSQKVFSARVIERGLVKIE